MVEAKNRSSSFNAGKSLPSAFLGLSRPWWLAWDCDDRLFSPALGFAGLLLTFAMLANQIVSGYSRVDRTLSGLGWLMAALAAWRGPWVNSDGALRPTVVRRLSRTVLIIEGVQTGGPCGVAILRRPRRLHHDRRVLHCAGDHDRHRELEIPALDEWRLTIVALRGGDGCFDIAMRFSTNSTPAGFFR